MEPVRWEAAAEKWVEERSDKADIKGDRQKLKWLETRLSGKMLHEIDRDLVKRVVELKPNKLGLRINVNQQTTQKSGAA